jgi:malate synthase
MTPRDEAVHEFVRDLNRAINKHSEWELQDVPQNATDDWEQWLLVREDLGDTVRELQQRVMSFFPML